MTKESIVYSINISDIQQVAEEDIERHLSVKEVQLVADRVGDYLDWSQAISLAIHDMEQNKLGKASVTEANMASQTTVRANTKTEVGAGDTAAKVAKPVAKPPAKRAAKKTSDKTQ